jgi:hypothetical protein
MYSYSLEYSEIRKELKDIGQTRHMGRVRDGGYFLLRAAVQFRTTVIGSAQEPPLAPARYL